MADSNSRFRAKWLTDNPAPEGGESDEFSWMGWSQQSALLARIHNAIADGHGKKYAKAARISGPRSKTVSRLFAPTIADFNTDAFMARIIGPS